MADDDFYLYLPSNSSAAYHDSQSVANFKTTLAQPVLLEPGCWEVGLASLCYPRSWFNVKASEVFVTRPDGPGSLTTQSSVFPAARYRNAKHLISTLASTVYNALRPARSQKQIALSLHEDSARFIVRFESAGYGLELPPELAVPLGLTSGAPCLLVKVSDHRPSVPTVQEGCVVFFTDNRHIGPHAVNPNRMIPSLYIYCDLVRFQRVGDMQAPILAMVAQADEDEGSEQVLLNFAKIHYSKAAVSSFSSVELHTTDGRGRDIEFDFGVLTAKLHIRRCR